jgi:hypothetical protein
LEGVCYHRLDVIISPNSKNPSLQAAASTATLTTGGLDNEPRSRVTETSGGACRD